MFGQQDGEVQGQVFLSCGQHLGAELHVLSFLGISPGLRFQKCHGQRQLLLSCEKPSEFLHKAVVKTGHHRHGKVRMSGKGWREEKMLAEATNQSHLVLLKASHSSSCGLQCGQLPALMRVNNGWSGEFR